MDHSRKKLRLGDVLVNSKAITNTQLLQALDLQKGSGKKLGEVLVEEGIVTEEQIAMALSTQLHIELIDLTTIAVSQDILDLIPVNVLKKNKIFPISLPASS